jgi:hypothetical protein
MERRDLVVFCVDCAIAANGVALTQTRAWNVRSRLHHAMAFLISLSKGAPVPPRGSAVPYGTRWRFSRATAVGYASLPFFATNLLISAFVGSGSGTGYPAQAMPVGLGTVPKNGW